MSFLAGRLAGKEGAYFLQESKQAVSRLVLKNSSQKHPSLELPSSSPAELEPQADVLPEVLRHSLPSKIFFDQSGSASSLSTSKWVLHSDPNSDSVVSPDILNPLRAYVSLPQVTFGPKRWDLPQVEHSVSASTANELRKDRHAPINPEKLKAAAEGLAHIGKAFAIASAFVFGGATLIFGLAASKLDMNNSDEIRAKRRELIEPKLKMIHEQLVPLKAWVEDVSKKYRLERDESFKEKPIIKELSRILGAKNT